MGREAYWLSLWARSPRTPWPSRAFCLRLSCTAVMRMRASDMDSGCSPSKLPRFMSLPRPSSCCGGGLGRETMRGALKVGGSTGWSWASSSMASVGMETWCCGGRQSLWVFVKERTGHGEGRWASVEEAACGLAVLYLERVPAAAHLGRRRAACGEAGSAGPQLDLSGPQLGGQLSGGSTGGARPRDRPEAHGSGALVRVDGGRWTEKAASGWAPGRHLAGTWQQTPHVTSQPPGQGPLHSIPSTSVRKLTVL